MKRRAFIAALGGAAAWPLGAPGQQAERMRRVGVLMNLSENDATGQKFVTAFRQRLQQLGWVDGGNAQIEIRWTDGDPERFRKYAAELVALAPDVILASSTPAVTPLRRASRTVPIVFVLVVDPLGSGLVASLARPGGNATGFTLFEYSIGAKWLELLKEVAPYVTRAGVMRDSTIAAGIGQFAAIQTMTATTGMDLSAIELHEPGEIEVARFAQGGSGGLIVTPSPFGANHRDAIASWAAKYRLPAVYHARYYVTANGLISYGPVYIEQFQRAVGYVDRILRGEKPADLPVQAPTKYELVLNMRLRGPSASKYLRPCSPAPTRSSSDAQAPTRPAGDARQEPRAGRARAYICGG